MPRLTAVTPDARLLVLPWAVPLEDWPDEHLVALPRGISRHVVRFVRVGDSVLAAKELPEKLAQHEYRMLQELRDWDAPSVEPVGVVTDRCNDEGEELPAVLLTRHLSFSLPYRSLFSHGARMDTVTRLIDALVVLLARLHLHGFLWGDVSLSNVLFRRDASNFTAYLVDAETAVARARLTNGQRDHDLDVAGTNLYGEMCDLQAEGEISEGFDPNIVVELLQTRYAELWEELTAAEEFEGSQMHRVERRVRRLNALGFDVDELDITTGSDGRVRLQPRVVDAGHHSRRLMRLTGMDVQENQARRLLQDLDTFRWRTGRTEADEAVVAHQWVQECFSPVVAAVPAHLRGKREPAQIFHEVLDYRWFLAEREHREIPLEEATRGYVADILSNLPDEAVSSEALRMIDD